jgi:chromosome segregation ATPase
MFELSCCKTQVKNADKLKEASQAMCEGNKTQLIIELEMQLATANEELCKKEEKIKEFNGILKDAVVDYKQLVDDMKAAEKEGDDLDLKLAEKECELQHKLDDLKSQQYVLDKQLHSRDEKVERTEILKKQLLELQAKYDDVTGTVKLWKHS